MILMVIPILMMDGHELNFLGIFDSQHKSERITQEFKTNGYKHKPNDDDNNRVDYTVKMYTFARTSCPRDSV